MDKIQPKNVIVIILIGFILLSGGYLALTYLRVGDTDAGVKGQELIQGQSDRVIVYYFYGNTRCSTCMNIESYTAEAINSSFPGELNDSRLEWKPVNAEQPANNHFISDYNLYSRSVILSLIHDGNQTEWKNLDRVWELVVDKDTFISYVKDNVALYLGKL